MWGRLIFAAVDILKSVHKQQLRVRNVRNSHRHPTNKRKQRRKTTLDSVLWMSKNYKKKKKHEAVFLLHRKFQHFNYLIG